MEIMVRNAEGSLGQKDREYAIAKMGKLQRFFNHAQRVEIVHREDKRGHRIEVTVFADGFTVRGEEADHSPRAAIDLVAEKIENRLRRLKTRIVQRYRRKGGKVPEAYAEDTNHQAGEEPFEIKERKTFLVKPMATEEAALQMEMVGHPFFVYRSEDSGQIEVLYKRKDGRYGLLQPEG
jgi:putative sigma-54 modulation protein